MAVRHGSRRDHYRRGGRCVGRVAVNGEAVPDVGTVLLFGVALVAMALCLVGAVTVWAWLLGIVR